MIPKNEREKDQAICDAATKRPWRWWTSNSHRRLRSDAVSGDVAFGTKQRDGCDDIVISEADMKAMETAVNRIEVYIADAAEMERRIDRIRERVAVMRGAKDVDAAVLVGLTMALEILEMPA